ncbi:3-deoxy-D-manno-octulosonic acid kinase [uncultured Psychromonas sp.]|uniref:3-deoxy-D-manno-octulosonic acid kinase n=1 Tax=uncultured Psychromonas sp. TaxID=173974 RepID=UPI00260EC97F|nr:3-deoxy-D-manno-octulosonic acid kinase [uncultured Psychromonas sp.]
MFKIIQSQGAYTIYNEKFIEDVSECFEPQYWQNKAKVIGSAQGRGTTWFVELDSIQAALRHYHRGGLFGKIISDSYFFTGYQKARSITEFHLLNHLQGQGVNVPTPIAANVKRCGLLYKANILSEKIPAASDLVDVLQQRELTKDEYIRIGQEIKKLHQAHVNHTDLNIHNILLDENGQVWIIDFDKCYQQVGEDWKEGNLQRLLRSFRKELKKRSINWNEADWQSLVLGY